MPEIDSTDNNPEAPSYLIPLEQYSLQHREHGRHQIGQVVDHPAGVRQQVRDVFIPNAKAINFKAECKYSQPGRRRRTCRVPVFL